MSKANKKTNKIDKNINSKTLYGRDPVNATITIEKACEMNHDIIEQTDITIDQDIYNEKIENTNEQTKLDADYYTGDYQSELLAFMQQTYMYMTSDAQQGHNKPTLLQQVQTEPKTFASTGTHVDTHGHNEQTLMQQIYNDNAHLAKTKTFASTGTQTDTDARAENDNVPPYNKYTKSSKAYLLYMLVFQAVIQGAKYIANWYKEGKTLSDLKQTIKDKITNWREIKVESTTLVQIAKIVMFAAASYANNTDNPGLIAKYAMQTLLNQQQLLK